jgi:probable O-glycosylation ligase (exosortase A-associated)
VRDILVTLLVVGSLPLILRHAWIGVLVWSWLSYMNPHRLAFGFAHDMPFVQIVALTTLVAFAFDSERKRLPADGLLLAWVAFVGWMCVTTAAAVYPDLAWPQLQKVLKIQFLVLLTLLLITSRERVDALVWVIVVSIGFFGVKGGLFTLTTGGGSKVWGPPGGFIQENNALALALLMNIPLMYYLLLQTARRWVRLGLFGAMILSAASVLGSHSRGALVAAAAIGVLFWWRSRHRLVTAAVLVVVVPALFAFMPEEWHARMSTISGDRADVATIESMQQRDGSGTLSAPIPERDRLGFWPDDFSALGRVNAWNYAINVANARVTGAGFESWSPETFERFAPIPEEHQSAHSVFFSVLADHGWVGLALFALILVVTILRAGRLSRLSAGPPETAWIGDLGRSIQLSLIVYAIGGAFLSMAYFDLPWHLIALIAICLQIERDGRSVAAPAGTGRAGLRVPARRTTGEP